jgi:NAD-dependent DNA ligase
MVSEKVRHILISMGAPFTDEEMESMSDKEGWAWIYATRPPKRTQVLPEICFTGFGPSRKAELQKIAKDRGFKCVTSVTKNLSFLCVGDNPGPAKLREATDQGVAIISEEEFFKRFPG